MSDVLRPERDRASAGAVDLVVLGDGPAGSVAALTLAASGARVALLGIRRRRAAAHLGQCLPAQGWTWMRALGLADAFQAGPHLPIVANRSAWSSDRVETVDLIRGANGQSWLLERNAFDRLLQRAAVARGAAYQVAHGKIQARASPQGWHFRLPTADGPRAWHAGFAIDASGRAAVLALRHGATRTPHDRLVAAIARFEAEKDDADRTTLIEARKRAGGTAAGWARGSAW